MKLSKLYSNKPTQFEPITFLPGLNVIMGEIRLPENKQKDTHNLGKTTLGRMLDFCLLFDHRKRGKNFFLFKNFILFKEFVFFLEIELLDGSFLTLRRSVSEPAKISFKKHQSPKQDFSSLADLYWDHWDLAIDPAKELLDGLLDLQALKPWTFRKELGYLLRSQVDFSEVFQIKKFSSSKHIDWKPFLAHILGFDAHLIENHYSIEIKIKEKGSSLKTIEQEMSLPIEDSKKIDGILILKQNDIEKKQKLLDAFDFRTQDKEKTKVLIDDIDKTIAQLNSQRYSMKLNLKKITTSLEEQEIVFNPDDAQQLFKEAGIHFEGQIKKDFQQLIAFNKAITEERQKYLREEKSEIENELKQINTKLNELGKQRSESLSFLGETDIFNKYKKLSDEVVTLKADILKLQWQRTLFHRIQELRKDIKTLSEEQTQIQSAIEEDIKKKDSESGSLFSSIRLSFNEIVEKVIDRKALVSVWQNKDGHPEFKAEILDESGNATSADAGHTYKKLLCIAFDMAVVHAHLNTKFPRFLFHDGVLESLDDRKKENLITIIRLFSDSGIQHIVTMIDSDLPKSLEQDTKLFNDEEIVLRLHDEGPHGRLFKMEGW